MATRATTCGCRGIRKCLVCAPDNNNGASVCDIGTCTDLYQCYNCGKITETFVVPSSSPWRKCIVDCDDRSILYPNVGRTEFFSGTIVIKDFITTDEEISLIRHIDESGWAESQSGRRKQDYGPKVNFKKGKVKLGSFNGFPAYAETLVSKLVQLEQLDDFVPVELCNLDYDPSRGAAIDPHIDDTWIWGERLVTINLLSDTYLTFTNPSLSTIIHIPLPRCSLVIVMGVARHKWSHSISRCDIAERRVAMTMRELGVDFMKGNKDEEIGRELIRTASTYDGSPVNFQ